MTEPKRKLTFQKEKGLGKLRLRFDDGELKIRLSKRRDSYSLGREEAQELALWLSAWSLKLIDTAAKDSAKADGVRALDAASAAAADVDPLERKKEKKETKRKKEKEKKSGKTRNALSLEDKPHAVADGQQAN